ncbi:MAG TPA: hypothetical protein VGL48_16460 [Acidimicrobiales bacterium]
MVVWTWIQHHRVLSISLLAVLVIGAAGGTAWAVLFRTVASPVTLKEALRMYRRDQVSAARNWGLVQPLTAGVFRYRTSGGESLSLPGASRSFPAASDMVVSAGTGGCSVVAWVPITQHTEMTTVCPSVNHSLVVTNLTTHEVISGTTATTVLTCPATAYLLPPAATTGARWSATCHQASPSEDVVVQGVDLGDEPLRVGGQSVPTVHVRVTLHYAGPEAGVAPTDLWISTTKGLVVREAEQATVTQQGVHYHEQMDARLDSLTPSG